VLREVASLLRHRLRREEYLARYGGEEFCIVLQEAGAGERLYQAKRTSDGIAPADLADDSASATVGSSAWH